ncbi:hypothetical protein H5J22_00755 [Cetobacterium sp. 8H]|nr:hypothetical protein [Cetobacterium sp. 8H]
MMIENILEQIKTPMNIGFGVPMFMLFLYSLKKINSNPKENTVLPNFIAATGIIGTFVGIFFGLLEFDTYKLDDSIPVLLDGMKTAFFTSILGLGFSNLLKAFQSYKVKCVIKKSGKDIEDVSLEKIASLMFDIKETIVNSNLELVSSIKDIKENTIKVSEKNQIAMESLVEELVGNKDESLVGQIRKLRESLIRAQDEAQERLNLGLEKMGTQLDNLVKTNNAIGNEIERGNSVLIDEFRIFAKNMAENNMKAFTEAIQECIKDLNNQLQEQFGENFKHLNSAVEKLLEWQIHYKETIEKATTNQIELYNGMNIAKELVIEINERSKSIVEVANKLGDKIVTFDTQQQTLNSSIEVLNKISQEAKELIPNIDIYINEFKNKVIETTDETQKLTIELKDQMLESTKNVETYISEVDLKLLEHTVLATEKITDHVVTTTEKSIIEVNKSSKNMLEKINIVNQEAIRNISKLSDHFEEQSSMSISHINSIQNNMKSVAETLLETLNKVSVNTSKNIDENNTQIISIRNAIKELTQASTENIKNQQNEIIQALNNLTAGIKSTSEVNVKSMEDQISSIEKAVVKFENEGFTLTKKISDNIQVMVENNNSNLQTSIHNLNESLGVTLNTSLQSLGEQLAAVSEKFVSDYIPLTIELQKVVNLAKKVG